MGGCQLNQVSLLGSLMLPPPTSGPWGARWAPRLAPCHPLPLSSFLCVLASSSRCPTPHRHPAHICCWKTAGLTHTSASAWKGAVLDTTPSAMVYSTLSAAHQGLVGEWAGVSGPSRAAPVQPTPQPAWWRAAPVALGGH